MGKSRIRTKTSYFLVTTNGRLFKISPVLVGLAAVLCFVFLSFVGSRCYVYNKQLIDERHQIQTGLVKMNNDLQQMQEDLTFCVQNKEKISQMLYFNTDSGKTTDEK
ncbi:MAG: hypothetical protein A3F83_04470 [Candidatus Glassbacteria bacterium RIFCSPLOWO2_12_FULL_58_11]|uniref:Uncharacterized protein n=1 Tax=Candidatus Glassbacteria bacterium RIFCSPLOWO2_12_FULL_58_11 TaxID=1817867 RepID=A0A1F5YW58_9BACT|nr:MAG: hypothetical protein A3F83_04470 [Candidatus Glassbacteria bacterium RIFCSPLOWO2_12_FULL_58_11]